MLDLRIEPTHRVDRLAWQGCRKKGRLARTDEAADDPAEAIDDGLVHGQPFQPIDGGLRCAAETVLRDLAEKRRGQPVDDARGDIAAAERDGAEGIYFGLAVWQCLERPQQRFRSLIRDVRPEQLVG